MSQRRLSTQQLRLYLVTDGASLRGRALLDVVGAALAGGVSCVQLREKCISTREFVELGLALRTLLAARGVALVINDRLDVALACEADGLHLGQSDMPLDLARRLLPPHMALGLSVENLHQVEQAAHSQADYLGVSPVFATPTKTDTAAPFGLAGLAQARALSPLPLVAIGGIHAGNAQAVLAAGADGLAVVSAICSAADPRAAAAQLRALVDAAPLRRF